MKRTYRLVWNAALDAWVTIPARRSNPGKGRRRGARMHVLRGIVTVRPAGPVEHLSADAM